MLLNLLQGVNTIEIFAELPKQFCAKSTSITKLTILLFIEMHNLSTDFSLTFKVTYTYSKKN